MDIAIRQVSTVLSARGVAMLKEAVTRFNVAQEELAQLTSGSGSSLITVIPIEVDQLESTHEAVLITDRSTGKKALFQKVEL